MVAALALFGALIAPAAAHAATEDGEVSSATLTSATAEPQAPETQASVTQAPELEVPETQAPDADASRPLEGSQESAPSSEAPPDAPIPPEAVESDAIEAEASRGVIWVSFALSRVALIDGHAVGTVRGQLSGIRSPLSAATENDAYTVTGNWGEAGPLGIEAGVAYRITMLGAPVDYWILSHVAAADPFSASASASCHVYDGDPGVGGSIASPSPFTCDTSYTQGYPNARVTFSVALNAAAEAQGVIKTVGTISLQDGHYEPNVPYHVNGAPTVGMNSSTSFDVVLRDGDAPIEANLAKTVFVYRIVEEGTPRTFWVAGWSQNHRGPTQFSAEGKCAVYDQDPVTAPGSLDTLAPVKISPYTCTKTSERFVGYRGNYEATFTVAKRQMTDVSLPLQQKALVERVCGHTDNCGLSLAIVTDTFGPGKPVSDVINNSTDVEVTHTYTTSGSHSITNSGGFEIDLTAGTGSIGPKYETTLKVHYERSISATTGTTRSVTEPVPAHMRGWIEGTPPMIHTVGDIIVLDGGRYYNLTDVVVDFPNKDGDENWELTPKLEHLPPTGAPEVTLEGTVSASSGAGASGQVSLVGGAYSLPLTAIGPVAHTSTPGTTHVAASGSTLWSTTNAVADTSVSGGAIASGSFTYQIAQDGMPTEYWVEGAARTWNPDGSPSSSCVIFRGSPHSGGIPVEDSPYRCTTTIAPAADDGIVRATFTVAPVEADGPPVTPPPPDTSANPPSTSQTSTKLAKSGPAVDGASLIGILAMVTGAGLLVATSAIRRARPAPSRRA